MNSSLWLWLAAALACVVAEQQYHLPDATTFEPPATTTSDSASSESHESYEIQLVAASDPSKIDSHPEGFYPAEKSYLINKSPETLPPHDNEDGYPIPPPKSLEILYNPLPTAYLTWNGTTSDNLEQNFRQWGIPVECKRCIIAGINSTHVIVQDQGPAGPGHVLFMMSPVEKCKISGVEVNVITQALKNINDDKKSVPSVYDAFWLGDSNPNACVKTLIDMKTVSQKLDCLAKKLQNENLEGNKEEYMRVKKIYDEEIEKLTRQIEFVKKQSDAESEVQNLVQEKERLVGKLSVILKKLEDILNRIDDDFNRTFIISAIIDGKFIEALEKFEHFHDKARLADIVEEVYKQNKMENLLIFITTLSSKDSLARIEILAKLNSIVVEDNDNVLTHDLALLSEYTSYFANYTYGPYRPRYNSAFFQETEQVTYQAANNKISANWQFVTKPEDRRRVLRFAQDRPGVIANMWTRLIWLQPLYFHQLQRFDNLMKFSEMLTPQQAALFRYYLYQNGMLMNKNFGIVAALQIAKYEYQQVNKPHQSYMWSVLYTEARLIASGAEVCLRNRDTGRYVYEENTKVGTRQTVYARAEGQAAPQENSHKWSFQVLNKDEMSTFKIIAQPDNRSLYPAYSPLSYEGQRRRVFTWDKPGANNNEPWQIKEASPKMNSRYEFTLYNTYYPGTLDVEKSPEKGDPEFGSKVFTRDEGLTVQHPLWTVDQNC